MAGNPIEKISILKFLIAIVQAACTPANDKEWLEYTQEDISSKVLSYLETYKNKFCLYGANPFLQMPTLKSFIKAKTLLPKKKSGFLPTGTTENTTLYLDSQKTRPCSDADNAVFLICLSGFGRGGKQPTNKVVLSENFTKKTSSAAGPFLDKRGLLHNFLIGKTILETIWLNIVCLDEAKKLYPAGVGTPPWEEIPLSETCETAERLKTSLMGRLVPLSRFCLLSENTEQAYKNLVYCTEGVLHASYSKGIDDSTILDPNMLSVANIKFKKVRAVYSDPSQKPWLTLTSNANSLPIKHISRSAYPSVILWFGGLKISSTAGEQTVSGSDDFVESEIVINKDFNIINDNLESLKLLIKNLTNTLDNFFKDVGIVQKQKLKIKIGNNTTGLAINDFCQLVEKYFKKLIIVNTEDDDAIIKIKKEIGKSAESIYNIYCFKKKSRSIDFYTKRLITLKKYIKDYIYGAKIDGAK